MTTIIEDNALNAELQELYLVSKQWLSELTFLENELGFFRKRIERAANAIACEQDIDKISNIEKTHDDLKAHIMHYLHRLEPLITNAKQPLDINLIENYAQIKTELEQFSTEIQAVKKAALELTQQEFKTPGNTNI